MARRRSEGRSATRFALDTNCMIALVCGWHEHHAETIVAVDARLRDGASIVVPAAALLEAYSVLTRLPAPHRLAPSDAFALLRANFSDPDDCETVGLAEREYWSLLEDAMLHAISGGRTYDALIAATARKAGARELLTFNLRHFDSFGDDSLRIVSPAG